MNENLYHYTQCGLDWVYLDGGVTFHDTEYGTGVSIEDVHGLFTAIFREIISGAYPIRSQELRFMSSYLGLSQEAMGGIIGVKREHLARMEGERDKEISRTTFCLSANGESSSRYMNPWGHGSMSSWTIHRQWGGTS